MRTPVAEQVFGSNKAPLEIVLSTDFADLQGEIGVMLGRIEKLPTKIKDEADFAAIGAVAIDASALAKRIDNTRKAETDLLFDMQKAIKAHFDMMIGEVNDAMRPILEAANQYTREKKAREQREAEEQKRKLEEEQRKLREKAEQGGKGAVQAAARADALEAQAETITTTVKASDAVRTKMAGGGVATAKTAWAFEITDYDRLDLNALRPFFNRDHVEQAIRSMVRVQKGNTKINGVRVFEDAKASFRK